MGPLEPHYWAQVQDTLPLLQCMNYWTPPSWFPHVHGTWQALKWSVSNSLQPHVLYSPWDSLGQNTRVGSLSFLQGIFPTLGSNPGLSRYRQILYQPSHKRSTFTALKIRKWCYFYQSYIKIRKWNKQEILEYQMERSKPLQNCSKYLMAVTLGFVDIS